MSSSSATLLPTVSSSESIQKQPAALNSSVVAPAQDGTNGTEGLTASAGIHPSGIVPTLQ